MEHLTRADTGRPQHTDQVDSSRNVLLDSRRQKEMQDFKIFKDHKEENLMTIEDKCKEMMQTSKDYLQGKSRQDGPVEEGRELKIQGIIIGFRSDVKAFGEGIANIAPRDVRLLADVYREIDGYTKNLSGYINQAKEIKKAFENLYGKAFLRWENASYISYRGVLQRIDTFLRAAGIQRSELTRLKTTCQKYYTKGTDRNIAEDIRDNTLPEIEEVTKKMRKNAQKALKSLKKQISANESASRSMIDRTIQSSNREMAKAKTVIDNYNTRVEATRVHNPQIIAEMEPEEKKILIEAYKAIDTYIKNKEYYIAKIEKERTNILNQLKSMYQQRKISNHDLLDLIHPLNRLIEETREKSDKRFTETKLHFQRAYLQGTGNDIDSDIYGEGEPLPEY